MTTRRAVAASAAILCSACAPDEVSVHDEGIYALAALAGGPDGLRARVSVFDSDSDYTPPLGCERFAADTWISVGGQRLDIVTLGGVGAGGYCQAARAEGLLGPDALASPATVELGDDAGSRASPLWDALEARSAQLVSPADGVLRAGIPFVIRWSPDPYGFEFRADLVGGAGLVAEVVSVAGHDITAQLVRLYESAPDPNAPPVLILHADATHDSTAPGFVHTWAESWSIELPVTIELEPSPAAH